ncbi:fasciclin domain-containing protein [Besnoitia besnoiti]|uniref:Fasciclin domain-containing protein n=1 Tax=Besnoitia besnoiti TaxID=94643 RepID=A0A2A9MCQ8_BESBE|nr:fasciclin domain-containing protein [Besnoitia besnoiti]PFH33716.1 fasciclin domain-containing protein [Besnoitia besnoiti]
MVRRHGLGCRQATMLSPLSRLLVVVVVVPLLLLHFGVQCGRAAPSQASPHDVRQGGASQQSAAVTFGSGVMGTTTAGSTQNPSILHLASVQDHAAMDPDLSELNKLMQDCGATFYLEQTRDMTMFMPTNSAIKALLPIDLHQLPWEVKWRLLQYHIVPQEIINVEDIPLDTSKSFSTWEGSTIKITHKRRAANSNLRGQSASSAPALYLVNDISTVVSDPPRIENFNGASYKIDRVIIPPDMDLRSVEAAPVENRQNPEVRHQEPREQKRGHGNATNRPTPTNRPAAKNRTGRDEDGNDNSRAPATHGGRQQRHQKPQAGGEEDGVEKTLQNLTPVGHNSQTPVGNGAQAPDFLQNINKQHARWNQDLYLGTRIIGDAENTATEAMKPSTGIFSPSTISALGLPTLRSSSAGSIARSPAAISTLAIEEEQFPDYPPNSIQYNQNGPRPTQFGVPLSPEADGAGIVLPPHPFESLLVGNAPQKPKQAEGDEVLTAANNSAGQPLPSGKKTEDYRHVERTPEDREHHLESPKQTDARGATSSSTLFLGENSDQTADISGSLFSTADTIQFDPHVVSPSIAALGLADGLLPVEELLTHFWSKPVSTKPSETQGTSAEEDASANGGRGEFRESSTQGRHQKSAWGAQTRPGPLGDLAHLVALPGEYAHA